MGLIEVSSAALICCSVLGRGLLQKLSKLGVFVHNEFDPCCIECFSAVQVHGEFAVEVFLSLA